MDVYRHHINNKFHRPLTTTQDLRSWTVAEPQAFWLDLYDYIQIIPPLPAGTKRAYDESIPISSIPPFFENVRLNFTENVLESREPDATALIEIRKGGSLDGEKNNMEKPQGEGPSCEECIIAKWGRSG